MFESAGRIAVLSLSSLERCLWLLLLFYFHTHRINYYSMCCTSSLNWGNNELEVVNVRVSRKK